MRDSLNNYYTKTESDGRFVPLDRTITINGTTQDLSANRTWNVGTVTSITPGYGLTPQTAITSTGSFKVDTLVLDTVYAKISGSGNYIQNQFTAKQSSPSHFWVDSGRVDRLRIGQLYIQNDSTITFRGQKFIQLVSTTQFPTRYSTSLGYAALQSLKSGTQGYANTAFGYAAGGFLQSNVASEASSNSLFGDSAGGGLTTATANTAIGTVSLGTATNISKAVSIGWHNMISATSGDNVTSIGSYALPSNTANSPHTIVGALGAYNNTTGKRLTAIGYSSLSSNVNGNDNIGLGANTDVVSGSQSIAIGTKVSITGSNKLNIGNMLYGIGVDTVATSYPKFGIGVSVPSAGVDIRGGSATAGTAPLKLQMGTLLTVPENFAIEADGNYLYYTDQAGSRHRIGNKTEIDAKESVLSFSSPLTRSTNTISIPLATSSVNGYLSSADRTNFQTAYTYSQVGHLPLSAGSSNKLTGDLYVKTGSGEIFLGAGSSSNGFGAINFLNSNTVKNWAIGFNYLTSGALEFMRSTVAGGSTFSASSLTLSSAGVITVADLAGTGTRMVVADNVGALSTQAIPGGGGGGTVASVAVNSANGFAGTSSGGANPALTLTTTITGVLKGDGTAISAAVAGTDYENALIFSTPLSRSVNAISIANAAADGSTKGAAAFNSTNFSASSGVINTIQGISTAATPSFAGLTVNGALINSSATPSVFKNSGSGDFNAMELRGGTLGTTVNWQLSKDNTISQAFQLTPSTSNGGTTYTTPVFTLTNAGALSVSGTITGSSFTGAGTGLTGTAPSLTSGFATQLATPRQIAGVNFDGTANISLNNNAITNGAGYITASSTNTLTNKSGNISQWTNDSGYLTAAVTSIASGSGMGFSTITGTGTITMGTPSSITSSSTNSTSTTSHTHAITSLPSATTATTQTAGDNSTKVATTAYVDSKFTGYGGSFTYSGTSATTLTVTLGFTVSGNYAVTVTPSNTAATAQEYYVTNKTSTTFDIVMLSSNTDVTFEWVIAPSASL